MPGSDQARLPPGVSQRSPAETFAPKKLLAAAPFPDAALTAEQAYLFDVSGYCVLPGALSLHEVAEAAASPDGWAAGDGGCAVSGCLAELLGAGYRLDIAPGALPQLGAGDPEASRLVGGGCSGEGRRLRYWDHHGPRRCLGVRVVLALADAPAGAGGLTLLPASHKSTVPAPASVLASPEASLAAPLLTQPVLRGEYTRRDGLSQTEPLKLG